MSDKKDFGVLYGQKTTEDSLLIYSSYEDAKASPQTGDFIVLTKREGDGDKFLARVEAEIYDEDPIFRSQDKTLIAVNYARIAERDLSDRDKQKMFSYTYKVKVLGKFTSDGKDFITAVRRLPVVSYHARHMTPTEFSNILNKTNESGVNIGKLCVGNDIQLDSEWIKFDVNKLKSRRTMVFAQSGFGKTNLMKVLIKESISDTEVGKLVFDLNGEYFLNGKNTYGFGSIDKESIRDNLVVYSDKNISEYNNNFTNAGKVLLNMRRHMSVGDIINFGTGFSSVMQNFLYYLEEEQVEDFINNIDDYVNNPQSLHKKYPDFFRKEKDASATATIAAIRKRLKPLIEEGKGLHKQSSTLIEDCLKYLHEGKTVIIDLSLKDNREANIISTILVRKLFEQNKLNFTANEDEKVIKSIVFVEEAQNVLSDEFVKSNANPFVRIAKEGRKFDLGLVAITQRPSAISEEIRSQAENFFVMHMGNTKDIKALIDSNIQYDGVISKFIQSETIKGNLYMVSAMQSFAIPLRIAWFEKLVHKSVYNDLKLSIEDNPELYPIQK